MACWPEATSGARYAGEPVTSPVWVSAASASVRAMPKSDSFTWPSGATRMLDGFTSRCTIPAPCAAASASATWARIGAASSGVQPAALADQLGEVGALDVLHDQPLLVASWLVDEVEDRDHVGVVELGGQPGLALGAPRVGGAPAGSDADLLERDGPAEDLVAAAPDGAHAAATDLPSSVYLPAITLRPSLQRHSTEYPRNRFATVRRPWAGL